MNELEMSHRTCVDCKISFAVNVNSPAIKCGNCQDRDQSYYERGIQEGL